jgi:hypothetical protein
MRTAKPYVKSNWLTLIGSGGNCFPGMMADKSEHEKRTILWSDIGALGNAPDSRKLRLEPEIFQKGPFINSLSGNY